jgi:hypothetical protein
MSTVRQTWVLLLAVLLAMGCTDAPTAPNGHVDAIQLRDIPPDSLWWRWPCCGSLAGFPLDAKGVPTLVVNGQTVYHPSYITENALVYEDSYEKSHRPEYLAGLKTWTAALLQRSDTIDGAIYARFDFPFALHGDPAQQFPAGWHSGFTQGMLLSLLVRTATLTNDPSYAEAAHRVFRSFTQTQSRRVAHLDSLGYYWIDEYPLPIPDLTFNGFAYATRGLYEYWQWTRSSEAEHYLKAAITTLKHYAPQYRDPGKPSVYCLTHRISAPAYHGQVIQLLTDLYRMTGDEEFRTIAGQFAGDYTP